MPPLWIGILVTLAAIVVASSFRRRRGLAKVEPKVEAPVIFRDEPVIERATTPQSP
jgi:hypothetical protein